MEEHNTNIQEDLQEAVAQAESAGVQQTQPQMQMGGAAANNGAGYSAGQNVWGQQSYTPGGGTYVPYENTNAQYQQGSYQQPYQAPNMYQNYTGYQGQSGWQPARPAEQGKGASIASLICGIIALLTFLVPVLGMGCGIAGIVTAVVSRRQAGYMNGMALAGLICGIGGLVFQVVLYGFAFALAIMSEF